MDYEKFGIQSKGLLEMYLNGEFDVWNHEAYETYKSAEEALIKTLIEKLKQNQNQN